MSTIRHRTHPLCPLALAALVALAGTAQAQIYGIEDEGMRFADGTRVVCAQVEVQLAGFEVDAQRGLAVPSAPRVRPVGRTPTTASPALEIVCWRGQ
jgi:hypothetical protein